MEARRTRGSPRRNGIRFNSDSPFTFMKSPKSQRKGKKRNPFDFDAPRFTDFTRKHFVTTKGLLEDALRIPKSTRPDTCTSAEFTVTKLDERYSFTNNA
jgi:hypothetical protein